MLEPVEDGLPGAGRNLVAHEDTDFVQLLPFAIEVKQRADFKVAGGDIEGAGDLGPVLKVFQPLPCLVAVINDEKLAASFRRFAHSHTDTDWLAS